MKKRDGKIELLRFMGIIFIMCDHMGHIGLGELKRPFTGTWVYVEFFLMLSGFMTAKHFMEGGTSQESSFSIYVEKSIKYTINLNSRVYFVTTFNALVVMEWYSMESTHSFAA